MFDQPRLAAQRRGIQQRLGAMVAGRLLPFPVPGGTERHAPLARVAAAVLLVAMAGAAAFRILEMPDRVAPPAAFRAAARTTAPTRVVRETCRPMWPTSTTSTWRCCGRARPWPNCARSTNSRPTCATWLRRAADPRGLARFLMPPLIFRKGLDLKDAVAGQLADNYHSTLVGAIKETGYRYQAGRLEVHLAREFGFCYGVDRAVDYAYQARTRFPNQTRLPDRRDHPQPARQRQATRARDPFPYRRGRVLDRPDAGRRRHPAGLWRHHGDAPGAVGARLHAGRHHVRVGAQRLEERQPLRAGRPDLGHPRQGLARRDAGDGLAGHAVPRRPLPGRLRQGRSRCRLRLHPARRRRRQAFSPASATRRRRGSTPTSTWAASAWPTRRRC